MIMAPHGTPNPSENIFSEARFLDAELGRFEQYLVFEGNEPTLWIFGYGSLIWLPKVEFANAETGFVEGYAVRFWHGNTTHRGTPNSPGRVATMVTDTESKTWGRAFQLRGLKQLNRGLRHLCGREMRLGGYEFESLDVHAQERGTPSKRKIKAITFIGTPSSSNYLGPAPVEDIADTIVHSRGKSGHNLEYLFQLTDSLRCIAPGMQDPHLERLEHACHVLLASKSPEDDEYIAKCLRSRRDVIANSIRIHISEKIIYSHNTFFNVKRD